MCGVTDRSSAEEAKSSSLARSRSDCPPSRPPPRRAPLCQLQMGLRRVAARQTSCKSTSTRGEMRWPSWEEWSKTELAETATVRGRRCVGGRRALRSALPSPLATVSYHNKGGTSDVVRRRRRGVLVAVVCATTRARASRAARGGHAIECVATAERLHAARYSFGFVMLVSFVCDGAHILSNASRAASVWVAG